MKRLKIVASKKRGDLYCYTNSDGTKSHVTCSICFDTGFVDEVTIVNGKTAITRCPRGCLGKSFRDDVRA